MDYDGFKVLKMNQTVCIKDQRSSFLVCCFILDGITSWWLLAALLGEVVPYRVFAKRHGIHSKHGRSRMAALELHVQSTHFDSQQHRTAAKYCAVA